MRTCILLIVAMAAIAMPKVLCDDGYVEIPDINDYKVQGLGRWAVYEYDSQDQGRIKFNKILRGREDSSWFKLIINGSSSDTIYRNYEASVYQLNKNTQPKRRCINKFV
jgi:hypothetical protein